MYIIAEDSEVSTWIKFHLRNFQTDDGKSLLAVNPKDVDCIITPALSCGYFYASIAGLCLPALIVAIFILWAYDGCSKCCCIFSPVFSALLPILKVFCKYLYQNL